MTENRFCRGLKLSQSPPVLRFADFLVKPTLPLLPAVFGHYDAIPAKSWGMLANSKIGCCTISAAMHLVMQWCAISKRGVKFTDLDAQDDYIQAGSGYMPGQPQTDNGLDLVTMATFWRDTGMRDCTDARHKIVALLAISDARQALEASYLFDGIPVGIALPDDAEDKFLAREPWSGTGNPDDLHCVPLLGCDNSALLHAPTWGADQTMDENYFVDNLKEAVAVVTQENLINQKSPEGFAYGDLINYLQGLT